MLNNIDLKLLTDDTKLAEVFTCIVKACMRFYDAIDTNLGYADSFNDSGDTQIKLDVLADEIFSILMGDEVSSRRKFIEENAINVRNLDI